MKSIGLAALLLVVAPAFADDKKDDGFAPLFNGKNLDGWVNVNTHPDTFFVKDDMIITTGKPTGFLRTAKQYENFIAEFEWMHVPPKADAVGNSGFFVWGDPMPGVGSPFTRGIEVQVLVNLTYTDKKSGAVTASSHGDVFSIQGAKCVPDRPHPTGGLRCIPSENRAKGANEWNHYRIEAKDGVIKLAVNGKVVSGVSKCTPRKGYLALESEGSECRFKNLKIKEFPSSRPKAEEIAEEDKGFKNLYLGDLSGWKTDEGHKGHWAPRDWSLHYDGKSEAKVKSLMSAKEFGDYELIVDWRVGSGKDKQAAAKGLALVVRDDAKQETVFSLTSSGFSVEGHGKDPGGSSFGFGGPAAGARPEGQWNRTVVTLKGGKLAAAVNGKEVVKEQKIEGVGAKGTLGLKHQEGAIDFANVFIRELK